MFICPKCKRTMDLPACSCGHTVTLHNNIWQLSDMPDIITEGDGDKYIGYEYIGESYSGNRKFLIEERDLVFAKEISETTEDGIFLDLACGDGCFTVPCTANGTRTIAADISNSMLSILQKKAKYNGISLENTVICRMNALDIPLENESVDTVVANSVLHLISNPEKVIAEIRRVLKPGGVFLCIDDTPGAERCVNFDNSRYFEIVNSFYGEYWNKLSAQGVFPTKYSWKFDRDSFCGSQFSSKTEKIIRREKEYEIPIKDGFLPRFCGRGFSDQVDVPKELHESVITGLLSSFREKYGENFADITFKGIEDDLLITSYIK